MKKILFATVAVLALSACGEDKNSCEYKKQNLKTPKEACSCMTKIMDKHEMSMDHYFAFGEKVSKENNMEVFMKPSAEMKQFIEVARDVATNCVQHFEEKPVETTQTETK